MTYSNSILRYLRMIKSGMNYNDIVSKCRLDTIRAAKKRGLVTRVPGESARLTDAGMAALSCSI